MIVCVCRRLSERDIAAAIASGASCYDSALAACGERPNCGACRDEVEDLIAERRERAQARIAYAVAAE